MGIREKQIFFRAGIKVAKILPHLAKSEIMLDIGTGNGGVYFLLRKEGFQITAIDVKDSSKFEEVQPIIYDGKNIPFTDNSFDAILLLTILHHTQDPASILQEAKRVTKNKLIIIEDIYRNNFQKYLTFLTDSMVNWEWKGHPHSNKSAVEWEEQFEKLHLKIVFKYEYQLLIFFRQVIYILEK